MLRLLCYRPNNREARLIVEPREAERPDINLLTRLLVNRLQVFEQETGGVASVFIMDLENGRVVPINENVVMSGIDLVRVPIALETLSCLRPVSHADPTKTNLRHSGVES